MWIVMDEQYRQEKAKFRLKECCENCHHYCEKRNLCGMLYPVEPHRSQTFEQAKDGDRIFFCKMFEAK